MSPGRQVSLFEDVDDTSTLATTNALAGRTVRRELTHGAWVDLRPDWITGADELFDTLRRDVRWRAEKRQMYDRVLDVPRLVCQYPDASDAPHPMIRTCRDALTEYYRRELPEGFASAGLCLYRDGNDSVAWHGDTIGRGKSEDTMVAILSLGSPRPLTLRPTGGGPSLRFTLGHGDLLVMGGSCQRTWQHAVPKTTGVGPRGSVQFRPPGVW